MCCLQRRGLLINETLEVIAIVIRHSYELPLGLDQGLPRPDRPPSSSMCFDLCA